MQKQSVSILKLSFIVSFLIVGACSEQNHEPIYPSDKELQSIQADLQKRVEEGEVASFSIGVSQNGNPIWLESIGWSNKEQQKPATVNTLYPLASMSKSITATGIFFALAEQELTLEEPISKYPTVGIIQSRRFDKLSLSIKHLINMEAGIPHLYKYYYKGTNDWSKSHLKELVSNHAFIGFKPGTRHSYSNLSFGTAFLLLSDIVNDNPNNYLKRIFFDPLSMHSTYTDLKQLPDIHKLAKGYSSDGEVVEANRFEPTGGAGFYSTVSDLLKYGQFHISNQSHSGKLLMDKSYFKKMHSADLKRVNSYYLNGWGYLPVENNDTYLSNGAIAGAATTLLLIPEQELVVVVLTNSTVGNDYVDEIAFSIADSLISGYSEKLGRLLQKATPQFSPVPFNNKNLLSTEWSGKLRIENDTLPLVLRIEKKGDWVIQIPVGGQKIRLQEVLQSQQILECTLEGLNEELMPISFESAKLRLSLENDRLMTGFILLSTSQEPIYGLPYYVEFTRNE